MNSLRKLFLAVGAMVGAAQHSAAAEEAQTANEFLLSWAAAWQESDVDKMMDFYDAAEETTAVESLGRIRKGPEEIRKMYEGAFHELVFERVRLSPVTHGRHDGVAWATSRYTAQMRLKSDNSKWVLEVLGSFVMKREGDNWKITLEHFSTIPGVARVRPAGPGAAR